MAAKEYYEKQWDALSHPSVLHKFNNDTPWHYHSSFEFIYVVDGEFTAVISGREAVARKGNLIAVPGYTVHGYFTKSKVETLVLLIPKGYIEYFDDFFSCCTLTEYVYALDDPELIKSCFEALTSSQFPDDLRIKRCYVDLIFSAFTEQIACFEEFQSRKTNELIRGILEYIDENFSKSMGISDVAEHFNYSVSSFSRIFNKHIGYTFPVYLGMVRAKNAARLIKDENRSIIDAAFESGFDNLRTFYRVFKKNFSLTPNEYKKQYNN